MKRCGACGEEFQNQFNFCPVDGEALFRHHEPTACDYHPTIIRDDSLVQRLTVGLSFLIERLRVAWPQFKADPLRFLKSQSGQAIELLRKRSARPYLRKALAASVTVVGVVIMSVMIFDQRRPRPLSPEDDDLGETTLINSQRLPDAESKPDSGIGTNSQGRVGFNKGKGEGSGPTPARAQGGGSGGNGSSLPPSVGRLPQPSEIPAPIPTTYARALPQSLPAAGVNIDPVLWKDLPYPNYGDPRAKSTTPSNGPGQGGGVGTNKGTGIGDGTGPGVGPGNGGNIGDGNNARGCCGDGGSNGNNPNNDVDRVFKPVEVTSRARVISKPEPQYTEEARKAGTSGTVVLSVVFSRTGQVTNIRAMQTLCCGLTEKAIAAARSIRFIPAMRNGQVVSTYMQLEYNFNLY
jgi:TonB family protein